MPPRYSQHDAAYGEKPAECVIQLMYCTIILTTNVFRTFSDLIRLNFFTHQRDFVPWLWMMKHVFIPIIVPRKWLNLPSISTKAEQMVGVVVVREMMQKIMC